MSALNVACLVRTVGAIIALALLWPVSSQAHSGHTDKAAWQVCEGKERANACQYSNPLGYLYKGSCQWVSAHLLCVRNQPIEIPDTGKPATSRSGAGADIKPAAGD